MYNAPKSIFVWFCFIGMLLAGHRILAQAPAAVKVMCFGDSNTEGGRAAAAYRRTLYFRLRADSCTREVDFVGRLERGDFEDNAHEGVSGRQTQEMIPEIYPALLANPADIILLQTGTNDLYTEDPQLTILELDTLLEEIDRYERDFELEIQVVLAKILNRKGNEDYPAGQHEPTIIFNQLLDSLYQARVRQGDHLMMVDLEKALVYPDDMLDEVHPNPEGYKKVAQEFLEALQVLIPETALCPANRDSLSVIKVEWQKAGGGEAFQTLAPNQVIALDDLSDNQIAFKISTFPQILDNLSVELSNGQGRSWAFSLNDFPYTIGNLNEGISLPPDNYSMRIQASQGGKTGPVYAFDFKVELLKNLIQLDAFLLINSTNNQALGFLEEGSLILSDTLISPYLTIQARSNPDYVQAIEFQLSGDLQHSQRESQRPFTLFGDQDGNYEGALFCNGAYRLEAQAIYKKDGVEMRGARQGINFQLIGQAPQVQSIEILNENQEKLYLDPLGGLLDLSQTGPQINLKLQSAPCTDSISTRLWKNQDLLLLEANFTESPFFLYEVEGHNTNLLWEPEPGFYRLEIEVYGKNADDISISQGYEFFVIDSEAVQDFQIQPQPVTANTSGFLITFEKNAQERDIYIYDGQGNLSFKKEKHPDKQLYVLVQAWSAGLYFVEVRTKQNRDVQKLLIIK